MYPEGNARQVCFKGQSGDQRNCARDTDKKRRIRIGKEKSYRKIAQKPFGRIAQTAFLYSNISSIISLITNAITFYATPLFFVVVVATY